MPSTPALFDTTVRPFTPESRIASDKVSAMPQRPKPPDMIIMPSLRSAVEGGFGVGINLVHEIMTWWEKEAGAACIGRIIRRNLRNASMTGGASFCHVLAPLG